MIFEPDVFEDRRGFFFEAYNKTNYAKSGLDIQFVQDNVSKSIKGTVRGLHYQVGDFAQGKLCSVISGKVLDIAVDIRFGSPTFGKHYAVELSGENKRRFWIPPGFAHGFSVLSDGAIFYYKCSQYYSKKDERTIALDDKKLNIDWLVSELVISDKDKLGIPFDQIERDFVFGEFKD